MTSSTAVFNIPFSAELVVALASLSDLAHGLFLKLAMRAIQTNLSQLPSLPPGFIPQSDAASELVGAEVLVMADGGRFRLPHIEAIRKARDTDRLRKRQPEFRRNSNGRPPEIRKPSPTTPPTASALFHSGSPNPTENPKDTPVVPSKGTRQTAFSDRTAKVYDQACTWRRVGRNAALRAIERVGKALAKERFGGDANKAAAFLTERATAYAGSRIVRTTPNQFLPHPATWFNQGRYDDAPAEWDRDYQQGKDARPAAPRRPEGFS